MAQMSWSDALSTGITEQDEQHKNLIYLINRLNKAIEAGKEAEILDSVLTELVDYTVYHFGYEETLMKRHNYADTPAHKLEHEKFIEAVDDFRRKHDVGDAVISVQIINFLRMWVKAHIMQTDKKMGEELSKTGVT